MWPWELLRHYSKLRHDDCAYCDNYRTRAVASDSFHGAVLLQREIGYRVVNPQEDIQWPPPPAGAQPTGDAGVSTRFRAWLIRILRNAISQRAQNREIDVFALLCCSACQAQCDLQ